MNKELKIVFFGTPDFAVPSLEALFRSRHGVELVVTQPDRPQGRGRKLAPSPVKKTALKFNASLSQPESVNKKPFLEQVSRIEPDVFVVAAFGQIFSKKLLEIPKIGPINVHASLLPKYRGAAPIHRAIIERETVTGITTMFMNEKLDEGDILLSAQTRIGPHETAGQLHDRLAELGARVLMETLDKLSADQIEPKPQDHSLASHAPMLKKEDGRIDWSWSAEKIEAFIRGMTPWPGAYTFFENKRLKIFKAQVAPGDQNASPGEVMDTFSGELRVAAGKDTALSILEIQEESGKRLKIQDFLRGNPIEPGVILQ